MKSLIFVTLLGILPPPKINNTYIIIQTQTSPLLVVNMRRHISKSLTFLLSFKENFYSYAMLLLFESLRTNLCLQRNCNMWCRLTCSWYGKFLIKPSSGIITGKKILKLTFMTRSSKRWKFNLVGIKKSEVSVKVCSR